ncbi:hypothetical protein ACA910_009799 [Epithemia clementina (nom. ined.)]
MPLKATGMKSPASTSATPLSLDDVVVEAMNYPLFVERHSSEARKTMPLPILAIARHVAQATEMWFLTNTMELVIPVHRISGAPLNPDYHSVVGQSLFLVNCQSQFFWVGNSLSKRPLQRRIEGRQNQLLQEQEIVSHVPTHWSAFVV